MPALVDPDTLNRAQLRALRGQCDGEWERVTVDDDGQFVVHNNAWKAQQYLEKNHGSGLGDNAPAGTYKTAEPSPPTTPPAPPEVAPPPPEVRPPAQDPPPVRELPPARPETTQPPRDERVPDPELRALAHVVTESVEEHRNNQRRPGVYVLKTRGPEDHQRAEVIKRQYAGEPDWNVWGVEMSATKLHALCMHGLPGEIQFTIKPEVLLVWGLDMDAVEAALTYPDRVEIRPESVEKSKRYPILGFYRGDVAVILGMRIPSAPSVIAVYVAGKLLPDSYHQPTGGGTGGGGAKKQAGLPTSVRQSIRALLAEGAYINTDELAVDQGTADVQYRGQDVGKISVGERVQRTIIQSDYQRTLRRINAIKQREEAKGA